MKGWITGGFVCETVATDGTADSNILYFIKFIILI
jgi:hypothetical protein